MSKEKYGKFPDTLDSNLLSTFPACPQKFIKVEKQKLHQPKSHAKEINHYE
jgi:hypothetical protein